MKIGDREISVEQLKDDWAIALMTQGVIIKLSIGRWSGQGRLKLEDLGIVIEDSQTDDFMSKYIRLGSHKLLPQSILRRIGSICNRAFKNLVSNSFNTVWGNFVPFTAFNNWFDENEKIKKDFYNLTSEIVSNYDEIINTVKKEYITLAKDAWKRMYPDDKKGATDSFISDFILKIVSKIPTKDKIMSMFAYDVNCGIIPLPSFVADNIAKANEIVRNEEIKNLESELVKNAKIKMMEEYEKQKKELIYGFLQSTVTAMRRYVGEICEEVLQSLKLNKPLNKNSLNKIAIMVQKVEQLNFYNDKDVTIAIQEVKLEIQKFKGERNDNAILETLKRIMDVCKSDYVPDFNPSTAYIEA